VTQTHAHQASYNLADLWESVADAVPDRTAVVCGDRRLTYRELDERATRLAHWMRDRGLGPGQHVGCYLHNGTEYLEATLAAYKLRAVPINVNYRYVEDELAYLFDDADLVGVVHHDAFSPRLAAIRDRLTKLSWTLAVDGSAGGEYETALAAASPARDFGARNGDDHYVLYTGGTTGLPKGVVWRSEDAFFACLGGGDATRTMGAVSAPDELVRRIIDPVVFLPVAPLMHAAGLWTVFIWLFAGGRIVLLPGSLDAETVWRAVERERVNSLTVVGDPILRPLLDGWDKLDPKPDISSLFNIGSGGAPLSASTRERAMATFPGVLVVDGYGSSETGIQGATRFDETTRSQPRSTFSPSEATVLDEETLEPVAPGSGRVGKVARTGRIPLGYYNDPDKTARTFVTTAGHRWAVTGDMAVVEPDGTITVLGRGSQCINTGGEKVFPEEVEGVLRAHPDVYDVVVVGVADDRWGQRVVAVVQPGSGPAPDTGDLQAFCRASLAGYKVPKDVIVVDQVVRSPAGKADYRWAAQVAARVRPAT
jgi:acyl-CoA synthetase (AMP-forming)/AMP-acid ligase II